MGRYINKGNRSFQNSLNSEIYVDKTGLLKYTNRMIDTNSKFICNSRPRRFGKTVTAEMLEAYYSKGCDSESMFSGLEISKDDNLKKYLNQYDVIHFDVQWFTKPDCNVDHIVDDIQEEIFKAYPKLKRFYAKCGKLWSDGYFLSTVGHISEATVQRYIEEQKHGK